MNKNILSVITAVGILGGIGSSAWGQTTAETIIYKDLPSPVQKAIHSDKADIKRIQHFTYDGRTVYEVRLDRDNASDKLIYLNQDGTRINDKAIRLQRQADRNKLNTKSLPKAVRETYKREAGSAKMEDIDVNTVNGKTIYEFDYNKGGKMETMLINEDGSLVRPERHGAHWNNNNRLGDVALPSGKTFDRSLSGSRKFDYETAPEAVKRTVRRVAGANRIEDAERGSLDGKTVYELAFKENGVHNEVRVAEDGSIVQRISAGAQPELAAAPVKMTTDQVPPSVRRAIRAQVGSGEVNDIDKITVNGRTVYEVGFKREKGAAQQEVRIAEDGTVISEPAGALRK